MATQIEKNEKINDLQEQIVAAEKEGTDTADLKVQLKEAKEIVVA